VEDSARALDRLWRPIDEAARHRVPESVRTQPLPAEFAVFRQRFVDAMDDDFNTPEALGVLFDFNRALRADGVTAEALVRGAAELQTLAGALGLRGPRRGGLDETRITALIAERQEARRQRNFKRADEIRAEIDALGAILEDKPTGTVWRWKGR
jgi:cysteinyl-tRNA synthetase